MSKADVQQSLRAVANNLKNIKKLTKTAKQMYHVGKFTHSRKTSGQVGDAATFYDSRIYAKPGQRTVTTESESTVAMRNPIDNLTCYEGSSVSIEQLNEGNQLIDVITSRYNEQIGSLLDNIKRLSDELLEVRQENRSLKKKLKQQSKDKCPLPRAYSSDKLLSVPILSTPILHNFTLEAETPPLHLQAKRKNNMIRFEKSPAKLSTLRKIRAAPIANNHYVNFKQKLDSLNSQTFQKYLS